MKEGGVIDIERDLAHHREATLVGGRAHPPQRRLAVALKAVGRGPRLEGSAPQDPSPRHGHRARHLSHLGLAFHRARTGHRDDLDPAHLHPRHAHHRVGGLEGSPHELVGLGDLQHLRHPGEDLEGAWIHRGARHAYRAQHGVVDPRGAVHVVAHAHEGLDDLLHLLLGGRGSHDDDHVSPFSPLPPPRRRCARAGGSRR